MSDQQPDSSEEQGRQPEEAKGTPERKAGHEAWDFWVAAVGGIAGIAALVTVFVQQEYLILVLTFCTCIGLTAAYYIIGYVRKVKDKRLSWAFVILPVVTALIGILIATMSIRPKPPGHTASPNSSLTSTPVPSSSTPPSSSISAPTATSPAQSSPISVEIRPPSMIHAGGDAELDGTVTGLGQASLWIIEQPSDSPGTLVISSDGPVATSDGPWKLSATEIGDPSDIGHQMGFVAIRADENCSERFLKIIHDAGVNAPEIDPALYQGCTKVGTTVDVPVVE